MLLVQKLEEQRWRVQAERLKALARVEETEAMRRAAMVRRGGLHGKVGHGSSRSTASS